MKNFETVTGYRPGIIGRIAELHAIYYSRHWNFGRYFEAKVATELSEFIKTYDDTQDCIWSLVGGNAIEGSITIDSSSEESGIAHLRWFIVSDRTRGTGAGKHLMSRAMEFCDHHSFDRVYLWTFSGLEPARHLYQQFGFRMVEETRGSQWGNTVTEQRYERR